ncbi:MAG TPA: hypothetical protein VM658_09105, partial [bacterium]|nr:hypothetical protein [bacterium]
GFAKQVGVKAMRLFPRLAAKKHPVLLGEPWRSSRLGVFLDVYFGQVCLKIILGALGVLAVLRSVYLGQHWFRPLKN